MQFVHFGWWWDQSPSRCAKSYGMDVEFGLPLAFALHDEYYNTKLNAKFGAKMVMF